MPKISTDAPTVQAMKAYSSLALIFLLLILFLPANSHVLHDYNFSPLEYRVMYFAIALPSLAVWFAAFYSYAKLQEYAEKIKKTPEGGSFARLAEGCKWLAWSLPVPALAAIILNTVADKWEAFLPADIIIVNYIALFFSLVAMTTIGMASREFVDRAKIRLSTISAPSIMLLFLVGGVTYCYLTFQHFAQSSLGSTNNPYFLPVWLMLLTIIIPYLYAWFVGLLAMYEITSYRRQVRGVLYKQALHLLVVGLTTVIAGSIALQYISSVVPPTGHLVLNYRLVLIVLFRIVNGIGFVLITLGALRLRKIEEV